VLVFLRRGTYYLYQEPLTVEKLEAFAVDGYESAKVQGKVPEPATAFTKLWNHAKDWIERTSVKVNNILIKNQETGEVNYPAIALAFGLPLMVVVLILVNVMNSAKGAEEDRHVDKKPSKNNGKAGSKGGNKGGDTKKNQ
jgi:hypothetical protein